MMTDASWFTALTKSHPLSDPELAAAAADFDTLDAAWNSEDVELLIWLAARLAPTPADLRGVVATAAQLVHQRLRHIDPAGLDLAPLIAHLPEVAEHRLDRQALSAVMDQAWVHHMAASSLNNLLEAALRLASAKDDQLLQFRKVPSQLASAVQAAGAAIGSHIAATGGPFTRISEGDALIRARHQLIDGQIRLKS